MNKSIAMELAAVLAEDGFSVDELVVKTKLLFERDGMAGFVSLRLELVDAWLCREVISGGAWRPKPCCEAPCYELQDRPQRRLRTSIGTVRLRWRRLRCRHCGRSCLPLREFTGLEPYQPKTAELERIVTEVVAEQNYRRLSRHLRLIGEIPAPKSTAHRWVMASNCDAVSSDGKRGALLFADGTGYKRRGKRGHSPYFRPVKVDGSDCIAVTFAGGHHAPQSAAAGRVSRTASRTARARATARSASGHSMSSQFSGYRVSMEYRLSVITWPSSMSSFRSAGNCRTRNRRSWVRGTRSACDVSSALRYFSAQCWA